MKRLHKALFLNSPTQPVLLVSGRDIAGGASCVRVLKGFVRVCVCLCVREHAWECV